MKTLERLSELFGKYMALIVLGVAALSVGMTSVSTLLAPLLTPAITWLLLRTTVTVDVMAMFLSIVKVILVPIGLGFLGFCIGRFFRMPWEKIKAVSIEIGMQNSGLATSLAGTAFPDLAMATVPGAIFSVWHNISGAILAGIYRKV